MSAILVDSLLSAGNSAGFQSTAKANLIEGGIYKSRSYHGKGLMKKILCVLVLTLFAVPGVLFAKDVLQETKELPIVKDLFPPQIEVIEAKRFGESL